MALIDLKIPIAVEEQHLRRLLELEPSEHLVLGDRLHPVRPVSFSLRPSLLLVTTDLLFRVHRRR
jgi:hypothetical protein